MSTKFKITDAQTQKQPFWQLSIEETERFWNTSITKGLSDEEATRRLEETGPNRLEQQHSISTASLLIRQLKSPLILILITAGVVTATLSHPQDSIFIFVAVAVNTFLGFWQEKKAEQALSRLKEYLKQTTRVRRNGKPQTVSTESIVPGDILELNQGDRVPADARLCDTYDVQMDESLLTGESLPVSKQSQPIPTPSGLGDQSNMVFAGTLLLQGTCTAIVCRTDVHTELGAIATLLASTQSEQTPLQRAISRFSISLSIFLGILTAFVFLTGVHLGQPVLSMFLTSVAIAVSAIPEGLPVSLTVILAVGVERMAKRKGVVRKLIAAEALGSTTLILTDKTGTLTEASMRLTNIIPSTKTEQALLLQALANMDVTIENPQENPQRWNLHGKIMETALVRSMGLRGMPVHDLLKTTRPMEHRPFNPTKKYSLSLCKTERGRMISIVGAPELLVKHSNLTSSEQAALIRQITLLAESGERILGVASVPAPNNSSNTFLQDFTPHNLQFDGLLTFRDPVRTGIASAMQRVEETGVRTIILTGDHQGTAIAVAKEIGISVQPDQVLDAVQLQTLSDDQLQHKLPFLRVISRVTPTDKQRIAKLFQHMGEIVAMTGDGVNDAPSLKQANVGIAMGSGTEVTKSVADLILLDDNFETIVAAIEEGRQILHNVRKVLVYVLSNATDALILIAGSLLLGLTLPLNAAQILWVNFFSGSFPAIAFAFEKDAPSSFPKPNGKLVLFTPIMRFLVLVIGVSTSALLFILYEVLLNLGHSESLVKTFVFAAFGTYALLGALSVKSLEQSIFSYSLFSNIHLTGGIGIGLFLTALAIYAPPLQQLFDTQALPPSWLIGVGLVGMLNILLIETAKLIFRRRGKSTDNHPTNPPGESNSEF